MTLGEGKIGALTPLLPGQQKTNFFYDDVMQGLFFILFSFLFL